MPVTREELHDVVLPVMQQIEQQMQTARGKHGPYEWSTDSYECHIYRAIKHMTTWLEVRDGLRPPDGEDHLALGMVRACMALAKRSYVDGLTHEQDAGIPESEGDGCSSSREVEPVGEDQARPVWDN